MESLIYMGYGIDLGDLTFENDHYNQINQLLIYNLNDVADTNEQKLDLPQALLDTKPGLYLCTDKPANSDEFQALIDIADQPMVSGHTSQTLRQYSIDEANAIISAYIHSLLVTLQEMSNDELYLPSPNDVLPITNDDVEQMSQLITKQVTNLASDFAYTDIC